MNCNICPRNCNTDRNIKKGICGEGSEMRVSKIMLHHWEEPCISGTDKTRGSGAVFFSGCSLHCVYCQNSAISGGGVGEIMFPSALAKKLLELQDKGAYNINFVTPTHFTLKIIETLDIIKDRLNIPVVWNTSGYEKPETVKMLDGYVDIFLTDFKYLSAEKSKKYSFAPDYAEYALPSLTEMVRITGKPVIENGLMKKGTIVRHLVLPGGYKDSIGILNLINDKIGADNILLALMSQYTPEFLREGYGEINRRITSYEYGKVLDEAEKLGFDGFMQARASATNKFTPDFETE